MNKQYLLVCEAISLCEGIRDPTTIRYLRKQLQLALRGGNKQKAAFYRDKLTGHGLGFA